MAAEGEIETLKDTCTYAQQRLTKYFNGQLYVVEIRVLKEKKKTNRKWGWTAHFYINSPKHKVVHKLSINSNDQRTLGF